MIFNKYNTFIYKNTSLNHSDFFEKLIFKKNQINLLFTYSKNAIHLFILILSLSYINYVFITPIFKGLLKKFLLFDKKILNFLNKNSINNFYYI
jgi:hypothetical protein